MPFGDGTGPMGSGPMTGRAAGFCAGFGRPGYADPLPGYMRGYGYGRRSPARSGRRYGPGRGPGSGFGRGWWRRGFYGYPW